MVSIKELLKITGIPVLFASLCCLSPIILLLFGFGTVSYAASLTDVLYGQYKWIFRLLGLILLTISLIIYFRKKKICTIDQVKRRKNEIVNTVLVVLISAVVAYIIWLYVIVHYWGVFLNIWS
ncbi:hypothetical protein HOF78_03595 [Candidatus Woesearchaeota archaeon]|jgi:hypothetical protein|nr:hypothetical protein [Candidatus Woesearchaeota archaeon]MBT6044750.1 hypothetical protein [Candidatus Woesearchaeota archaeon]